MIAHWWYSLLLAGIYVGTFNLWLVSDRGATVFSGLAATAIASAALGWAVRRRYFRNRWDALIHVAVIADILLEALLVPAHDQSGFYLCALAFAVVVVAYRRRLDHSKAAARRADPGKEGDFTRLEPLHGP